MTTHEELAATLAKLCDELTRDCMINRIARIEPLIAAHVAERVVALDAPDKIGYWWFMPLSGGWELVEARHIYSGSISLYAMEKGWGGYNISVAAQQLPGKWIYIPRPKEL